MTNPQGHGEKDKSGEREPEKPLIVHGAAHDKVDGGHADGQEGPPDTQGLAGIILRYN